MTSLERLRSLVEAGTPKWSAEGTEIITGYRSAFAGGGDTLELEANAVLAVASHALARAMVSEEAVEKVAKAHFAALNPDKHDLRWADAGTRNQNAAKHAMRAALEALAQLANTDQEQSHDK
jgi:hypothetical protein